MNFDKLYSLIESHRHDQDTIIIRGEYWFDEDGNTMYADGDVGDMNHEMHVEQLVTSQILNYFNLEIGEFGSFDLIDYEDAIREVIIEDEGIDVNDRDALDEFDEMFYDDPKQLIEDYIVKTFNESRDKISKMLYMRDARAYAIEEWSWSRVHGNHIEVNKLTSNQLKLVSSGIWNALDEEGLIYEDEERMIAGQSEYYISTYTGKSYTIKLDDMDSPENISGLEETPIQSAPNFANIDKKDQAGLSDFYKGKPFGDSVIRNRKLLIAEDAMDSLEVQGNWTDGKAHGYDKPSLKMMANPLTVERIKKKWEKLPYDVDAYIIKGPKVHQYTELGRVTFDFVRDKLGMNINYDDDKITVIYTNNKGSERIPLTPWTLAHRLGHAMARDTISRESPHMYREINRTIDKLLLDVAKYYGRNSLTKEVRSGYSYNSVPDEKLKKALVYVLATFKSARDRKLRASFEFTNELIAQYVITGKVTLNTELPKLLPLSYAWGKPQGYHLRFTEERTEEDLQDLITQAQDAIYYDIDGLFGASIGNIYVM